MTVFDETGIESYTDIVSFGNGFRTLYIADDCNDVQWIDREEAKAVAGPNCETCGDADPTWRKVYVKA